MSGTDVSTQGAPAAPSSQAERRQDRLPVLLATGIALLTAVPVIEGKLQAFDVACLGVAPFLVGRVWRYGLVRVVSLTLVAWAVGQLLSDVANGLGPRESMQVVTAATVLVIVPVLVFLGRNDFSRIRWIVAGVMAGLVLELIFVEHVALADP